MNTFNLNREWKFIISETRDERPAKNNLIKRETLFGLQILLSKLEIKNYLALKEIYTRIV